MTNQNKRATEVDLYTEVWRTIQWLRQRQGMARRITEDQVLPLLGLSAVEDQVDFAGHGSRVLAVDEVLRCIASRLSNPNFRKAYANALNIDEKGADNLTDRRMDLLQRSDIGGSDALTNLEDDSFRDAAQLLLRTGRSPCRDDWGWEYVRKPDDRPGGDRADLDLIVEKIWALTSDEDSGKAAAVDYLRTQLGPRLATRRVSKARLVDYLIWLSAAPAPQETRLKDQTLGNDILAIQTLLARAPRLSSRFSRRSPKGMTLQERRDLTRKLYFPWLGLRNQTAIDDFIPTIWESEALYRLAFRIKMGPPTFREARRSYLANLQRSKAAIERLNE